jgi:hypothetical protein
MKNIAATIAAAGSAIIILGAAMMPTTVSAAQIGTLSSDINGFCVDDMQSYSCYDDGCYTDSYNYIDDDYYMRGYHYDEDDCVTAATGDAYPGTYVCGRAVINIERDNQFYDVNITWSNTAAEHTEWSYVCYYDQGSGSLIAIDNGSKETVGFNEKGRVEYSYTEYTDGSAQFMLDGDELYWEDLEEAAGSGMVFEQV